MKQIIILALVLLSLLYSCKQDKGEAKNQNEIELEVNDLLNNWHKSASEANFDSYFGAMDSISIYIGTDASENWTKKEFADFSKPYFDKGKAWNFTTIERNIYFSKNGDIAWFDELLNTWMGICRGSGVLEKTSDKWKIKHYVLSVSIPNEDIKTVVSAKIKTDSVFLKKYYEKIYSSTLNSK